MTDKFIFPEIDLVSQDAKRPFWSVMIPTYNGTQYLEKTLVSVLEQAPSPDQMQIEVIDDCSSDEPEKLVEVIGKGRISFYRNSTNLGLVENWNACIRRSHGHWVHILHQDDIILPGFYKKLENAITTSNSDIGSAFCRYIFMDEYGHWLNLSRLERRTPGIIDNWIQKIAVTQLIQFPSVVVKRSVYETLGGFLPDAHYAADWEMWKRIAVNYFVCYEPEVLACYRQHTASETSRLTITGRDIADLHVSINISKTYLPADQADELSIQASEHYALYALNTARQMINKGNWEIAKNQVREAFKLSFSVKVLLTLISLFKIGIKQFIKQKILFIFSKGSKNVQS